jgi:L-arabinose isomerase
MKHYEFWFIVGSQTLYGEDVLTTVANRAEEMAQKLSAVLPYPLKYKVTAKSSAEITQVVKEANYDDSCAGIVTWCHTFSPSKMWINGLDLLQKPWLHFATQYNREIPNEEIDMDFMNLNQAAHGDREFGYIVSRLGIKRKVVVGHYTDPEVAEKLALRLKFDAENGKGSYLKARSSEICEILVKRFGLDLSKKKKRASVKKSDDAENEE